MNLKSKRQLSVPDRISGLPDELLSHILSFLDTQYSVRTCVLSTRWKNIWASVPTLDFRSSIFSDPAKFLTFIDYLLFFRNSSNIQKFLLHWVIAAVEHSCVNAWINTVIRRNVVEIDLFAISYGSSQILELPKSLFMCKTLESLRLSASFIINLPASGCFPSLMSLYVGFYHQFHGSMLKAFSNLPKLEDLTIHGYTECDSSKKLKIAAPALKRLSLGLYTSDDDINSLIYLINCPKLESLYVNEGVPSTYYWGKANSLVRASIYLDQHCSNEQPSFYRVTALLAGVSNVTELCLSAHCFEVGSLPVYENLRHLKLVVHDCFCWELLTELLKRSPFLESLVLERKVGCQLSSEDSESEEGSESEESSDHEERSENEHGSNDEDVPVNEEGSEHEADTKSEEGSEHKEGSDNEDELESVQGSELKWTPPDCVPKRCWYLKTVSIEKFMGDGEELEVAKYLLQHGHVLDKMTMPLDDLNRFQKEKIYEEILLVPRGSRTCRVEFTSKGVLCKVL